MKPFTVVASLLLPACLSAFAIACSAINDESNGSDGQDLTGSIDRERKCAAANAYDDADISALTTVKDQDLPPAVRSAAGDATVSSFEVSGVGTVYISSAGSQTKLFDRNGRLLVTGNETAGSMRWFNGTSPLKCGNGSSSSTSTSSSGWWPADASISSTSSTGGWWPADASISSTSSTGGWWPADASVSSSSTSSTGGWWGADASAHP